MKKYIQSVKGMHDFLPEELIFLQKVEKKIKKIFSMYAFNEIRTPILEKTKLFLKNIGKNTDIVKKEMYTFAGKDGKNITLRPENTLSCARACIQHGLLYKKENKLWYSGPMFRYERPQKGRYRQFHQLGVEVFGYPGPDIDSELIAMSARLWKELHISNNIILEINSIGSIESRKKYQKKLLSFLLSNKNKLDKISKNRLSKNPLKILDSKNLNIQKILHKAPKLFHYIDQKSKIHFNNLCKLLDLMKINYKINNSLVRGLDYYNKTVFEWKTNILGAQGTICAGGRYDNLIEKLGGKPTKAIGFGIGLERLILLISKINPNLFKKKKSIDIYLIAFGEKSEEKKIILSEHIRDKIPNLKIMIDHRSGNIKKKIKKANKHNAKIALILEDENMKLNKIKIKNLKNKKQKNISQFNLIPYLKKILN